MTSTASNTHPVNLIVSLELACVLLKLRQDDEDDADHDYDDGDAACIRLYGCPTMFQIPHRAFHVVCWFRDNARANASFFN